MKPPETLGREALKVWWRTVGELRREPFWPRLDPKDVAAYCRAAVKQDKLLRRARRMAALHGRYSPEALTARDEQSEHAEAYHAAAQRIGMTVPSRLALRRRRPVPPLED